MTIIEISEISLFVNSRKTAIIAVAWEILLISALITIVLVAGVGGDN